MKISVVVALLLFLCHTAFAGLSCVTPVNGQKGFLPKNDFKIHVGDKAANTMTKERFNAIIDGVDKYYRPIVKAKGGLLKWARKWDDATVNASAQRLFKVWQVNMYGGLARHNLVTEDGFALVVCHELGHHLGGAPKIGGSASQWASNEGQADYFGTMKCFRRVFETEDNQAIIARMTVDPLVKKNCAEHFTLANDQALCVRAAMAGKSLADLLAELGGRGVVNFATPDPSRVSRTSDTHPAAQCRLDTYFQGSLCDKDVNDEVDNSDAEKGVCTLAQGYTFGTRPLCWYKP